MNDPKVLRKFPERAKQALANRGAQYLPGLERVLSQEGSRRDLLQEVETLRAKRNDSSRAIGKAKASKDEATAKKLMEEVSQLKETMQSKEAELESISQTVKKYLDETRAT